MRIATWNINGLRSRLEFILHWLRERRPDVVGLQEIKVTEDHFPFDAFEAEGYRTEVFGQKAWNGVAILHRGEAAQTERGLPGQEELGARLLTTRLADLSFTTVYCPNGKDITHDDYPRKLAWFDALAAHLAERFRADTAAVLCGDFNVCPAAIDSWNEERLGGSILHSEAERQRFARLLDWGFLDLFRRCHPDSSSFSWWDYRGGAFHRKMGLRIDFILGTPTVLDRVRSIEIDREYRKKKDGMTPSDHAPVIVDLG